LLQGATSEEAKTSFMPVSPSHLTTAAFLWVGAGLPEITAAAEGAFWGEGGLLPESIEGLESRGAGRKPPPLGGERGGSGEEGRRR